jgi:DNA transformation protein
MMAYDQGLVDWAMEALEPMGNITMRKMMGAATLYLDGVIFAVADDGEIWFKSDAESNHIWDEAGCDRFTFTGSDGKTESMNYRRAPADVYDDADAMREWAGIAVAAGLRGAAKKKPKKSVP